MSYFAETDLHGHTVESARRELTRLLASLPNDVRELRVIHGYRSGTALQSFVRSFRNPRIERKILGLNGGETIFLLKPR